MVQSGSRQVVWKRCMLAVETMRCNWVVCYMCLFGGMGMVLVLREGCCVPRKVGVVVCFV